MILYVQIDESTNQVIGYSSTKMHDNDVKVDGDKVDSKFLSVPIFFNYIDGKLEYDEDRHNLYLQKKANRLTDEQRLGQKCSDLEIQLLMVQQMMSLSIH